MAMNLNTIKADVRPIKNRVLVTDITLVNKKQKVV